MLKYTVLFVIFACALSLQPLARAAEPDAAALAQKYGKQHPILITPENAPIIAEAEEFQVHHPEKPGWRARNWGSNYYAATFAITFLSRKAYLSAPEQCRECVASRRVLIPKAGRYAVLVRYEAAYRFETQFRVQVEQNGVPLLVRQYGARDNIKIWPFRHRLRTEAAWPWGAVENIVWEGHNALVFLEPGVATISLIATTQPVNAARRNIDVVLLTDDLDDVQERIEKEEYLPLDGLLTQAGDVVMRVINHRKDSILMLHIPPGTEHSPYWLHKRRWKKKKLLIEPGKATDWMEVGSMLDTLNDGQWKLTAKGYSELDYSVDVRLQQGNRKLGLGKFRSTKEKLFLAYDANTRYTRRMRPQEEVLYDLVNYLKAHPVEGERPTQTQVYAYTFDERPEDEAYMKARAEFIDLMGIIPNNPAKLTKDSPPHAYIDVRHLKDGELEEHLQKLRKDGVANKVSVVSLGDEIGLRKPPDDDHHGFRQWLQTAGLRPADVVSDAGEDWQKINYDPVDDSQPRRYFYSQRYRHAFGVQWLKTRTDLVRKYLPRAGVGANYSPHHGNFYLGPTHKWLTLFRQGAMTMPWSEDYIWQVPVGSPQMNMLLLDMFRAGLKGKASWKIHYYVMPHWPGNTPNMWRRQFYGDLAHGMKVVNLFELRPVQLAYTENYVNLPEMYLEVRRALYELGTFEDIVQTGQVRPGVAGLWFSEVGDIWKDNAPPFAAAKRGLYIGIRHQQLALDILTDDDALAGDLRRYRILYLTDRHVSRAASEKIAEWVRAGGRLFATAGAGMFDEFNQPNPIFRQLYGIEQMTLEQTEGETIGMIKQDLPYAKPIDYVTWTRPEASSTFPIFGVRTPMKADRGEVHGTFANGSPAIVMHKVGRGQVLYCGFLPSLTYFRPAIPKRVLDRGTTDQSMAHLLPIQFDEATFKLIGAPAAGRRVQHSVVSSEALVDTNMIRAKAGYLIPVVNWTYTPIYGLKITARVPDKIKSARLASGEELAMERISRQHVTFTFNLDVADALVLRLE